jgi:hypothetical protein
MAFNSGQFRPAVNGDVPASRGFWPQASRVKA